MTGRKVGGGAARPRAGCNPTPGGRGGTAMIAWGTADIAGDGHVGAGDCAPPRQQNGCKGGQQAKPPLS